MFHALTIERDGCVKSLLLIRQSGTVIGCGDGTAGLTCNVG